MLDKLIRSVEKLTQFIDKSTKLMSNLNQEFEKKIDARKNGIGKMSSTFKVKKQYLTKSDIISIRNTCNLYHKIYHRRLDPAYTENEEYFHIPIAQGFKLFGHLPFEDNRTIGRQINIKSNNKSHRIAEILNQSKNTPNGIGLLYCNTNRMQVGCELISTLNKTAFILTHRKEISEQWKESCRQLTDIKNDDICIISKTNLHWKNKKIVICDINTLNEMQMDKAFFDNFGVFIYDEIETCELFNMLSNLLSKFSAKHRIGLTNVEDTDNIMLMYFGEKVKN